MSASEIYLVSHGCAAALASCRDAHAVAPQRGESVVLRSPRGEELGTVLCNATEAPFAPAELLRRATASDLRRAAEVAAIARQLAEDAQRLIDEQQLPLLALDADLPLDASSAIIHVLRWQPCTLTPLIEELSRRHRLKVYLLDRSREHREEDHASGCDSCGSGGCGQGGCSSSGCGSGHCSRGSTTAAELAAYFTNLRRQMERAEHRTPLL